MAEFERPKAQALSDAELARALQTFPSDATGIERAGELIAKQQRLREQDSQELQAWIELLRARDDQQSRKILSESMATIFPSEPLDVSFERSEPAVLTSELSIITRRGKVSTRFRNAQMRRQLAVALLLAVVSSLVLDWLELRGLSAALAATTGLAIAFAVSVPLKRHLLHPILRAAAVFGGRGVYIFAGLILGATTLFYLSAFSSESDLVSLAAVGPYSALLIVMVAFVALISQVVPIRFGNSAIAVATLASAGALMSQGFQLEISQTLQPSWYWGAAAVAVVSALVLLVSTPHTQVKWSAAYWMLPLTASIAFGLSLASPEQASWGLLLATFALMLGLAYSGRDLTGGSLGRFAGLSIVLGLALSPLAEALSGVVMALLCCALVLLLMDQLFRTSPLHVASLETSYGFYGSVSLTGSLALVIAGLSGTSFVTGLLPAVFNHLEWSLIVGVVTGLVFGLTRIPIIRRQDREIKNLDSSSGNIENLLGL